MLQERGTRRRYESNGRGGERDDERGEGEKGTTKENDGDEEGVEKRSERKKRNKNNLVSFSSVIC